MTDSSGSFSGRVRLLNVVSLSDVPGHELQVAEVTGQQGSTDPIWNAARVTYWAVTDVTAGSGTQRGYYVNERADGSRDWGTFEGKVASTQSEVRVEGTWRLSAGTGKLAGASAQGTFSTRTTSPTEVTCTWQGRYEVSASAQAA